MIDISEINPYIRKAIPSILSKGTKIGKRVIFDYELIYIEDGEFILNYNGTNYNCKKNQFILIRPGTSHIFYCTTCDISQPHIHFDITHMPDSEQIPICFKDINHLTDNEIKKIRRDAFKDYPQTPFVTFSNPEKALNIFYKIINRSQSDDLEKKAMLIILIDMLITDNFNKIFEKNTDFSINIEVQIKNYLDAGQGFFSSLDNIAAQFNYSKYHLERCFKKRYGISIMSYRNNKKMQTAKIMLQTETVSKTAEILGFSSIYVFSRAFKNHFGISPNDFKNNGCVKNV